MSDVSGLKVESPCERSPCMQWEGQDLNAQLFSPNGPAQEVPVSPTISFSAFHLYLQFLTLQLLFPSGPSHQLITEWPPSQRHEQPTTGVCMIDCCSYKFWYKLSYNLFFCPTAAQFLGSGELYENRGAHYGLGAEPQVHQHLPCQGACDVDKRWADAASQVSVFLWYNSWERLHATCVFYTHTRWISTNQRLNFFFFNAKSFYIEFDLGFPKYYNAYFLFWSPSCIIIIINVVL